MPESPLRASVFSDLTSSLRDLADAAGVLWEYQDSSGRLTTVPDDVLAQVLDARGYPAGSRDDIDASLRSIEEERWTRTLPAFVGAFAGEAALEVPVIADEGREFQLDVIPAGGGPALPVRASAAGQTRTLMRDGAAVLCRAHTAVLPAELPTGYHTLRLTYRDATAAAAECTVAVAPARLPEPRGSQWGLTVQLYSTRSRHSWGIGDFSDLADLAAAGAEVGADFVLINPIHAGAPEAPAEDSPYLPSSRQAIDPIYIRITAVPEYAQAGGAAQEAVNSLGRRWMWQDVLNEELPRGEILDDKILALETLYEVPFVPSRQERFEAFRAAAPAGMRQWAVYNAIVRSTDDGQIPDRLRDPASRAAVRFAEAHEHEVDFWLWTQFIAAEQLAAAAHTAADLGMRTGIITDLAVGVSHTGADAWSLAPYLATDATVGAPADYYNQQGQDWSQPPWDPDRLAAAGYAPLRDLFRTAFTGAGGIRIDHVMGLFRLWWVPRGNAPADGAYVLYDDRAILAVLLLEADRAGITVIGEDLGTVEPRVRRRLQQLGVLGTSVMWFERDGEALADPASYRRLSLATLNTHDMTPIAGYVNLDDIDLSERLGVLVDDPADVRRTEGADRTAALRGLPADCGLAPDITAGSVQDTWAVTTALTRFLARTDAALTGIALADVVGERRAQNKPGTSTEYPNWKVPLADGKGRGVFVDELIDSPALREIGEIMNAGLGMRRSGAATHPAARPQLRTGHSAPTHDQPESPTGDARTRIDIPRVGGSHPAE